MFWIGNARRIRSGHRMQTALVELGGGRGRRAIDRLHHTRKQNGKRTQIQRHFGRVNFLKDNSGASAKANGIVQDKLVLRTALLPTGIVPMQFDEAINASIDRVRDYYRIPTMFAWDEAETD